MKRPTWATVVGILGIIFGLFGLMASTQMMMLPMMIETQRAAMADMQKKLKAQGKSAADFKEIDNVLDKFWGKLPAWFKAFTTAAGFAGLIFYGLYAIAGIFLLLLKRHALRLFYISTSLVIALEVARALALSAAFAAIGFVFLIAGAIGLVIDLVLLIVVLTADKTAFHPPPLPPLPA